MAKHSPEPWKGTTIAPDVWLLADAEGSTVFTDKTVDADYPGSPEGTTFSVAATSRGNMERIVACVNACRGVPTEALNAVIAGVDKMEIYSVHDSNIADGFERLKQKQGDK